MDLLAVATQAHVALTLVAALCAAGVLILVPAARLAARPGRPVPTSLRAAIDWLIVGVMASVGVTAILGVVLFAAIGGPSDGLHAVYGAVALAALPVVRILGAGPSVDSAAATASGGIADRPEQRPVTGELTRRLAAWLVVGALITLGAVVRLAGTG